VPRSMPKVKLVPVVYSAEGLRGLRDAGGGNVRCTVVTRAVESMGAEHARVGINDDPANQDHSTVKACRDAFEAPDRFLVDDVPDAAPVATPALHLNAAGVGRMKTSVRITPEEIDLAVAPWVASCPPGHP